jgi:hypothetical protein
VRRIALRYTYIVGIVNGAHGQALGSVREGPADQKHMVFLWRGLASNPDHLAVDLGDGTLLAESTDNHSWRLVVIDAPRNNQELEQSHCCGSAIDAIQLRTAACLKPKSQQGSLRLSGKERIWH